MKGTERRPSESQPLTHHILMNSTIAKQDNAQPSTANRMEYRSPRYEVHNLDDAYRVDVYVPGVKKDNTRITLDKDTLTINATRSDQVPGNWESIHREYDGMDFQLSLNLNVDVDPDRISAKTEDGVLSITLPIAEKAKPKTIAVD